MNYFAVFSDINEGSQVSLETTSAFLKEKNKQKNQKTELTKKITFILFFYEGKVRLNFHMWIKPN